MHPRENLGHVNEGECKANEAQPGPASPIQKATIIHQVEMWEFCAVPMASWLALLQPEW